MAVSLIKTIRPIEAERRRIEYSAVRALAKIGRLASIRAIQAVRLGHSPIDASRAVLLGDDRLGHVGMAPVLARTMLLANLRGRRRSMLAAQQHGIESPRLGRMSRVDADEKKRKEDERRLLLLLLLDDDELGSMQEKYAATASKIAGRMVDDLAEKLEDAVRVARIQRPVFVGRDEFPEAKPPEEVDGDEARAVLKLKVLGLRKVFGQSGVTPESPFELEKNVGAAVVKEYERGRFDGRDTPEIKEALWGFRYSAILDGRTTAICRGLDGTVAPANDGFWAVWTPPNHFNCRSCIVEVWKSSALKQPRIIQPSASEDDVDRFRETKRKFLSYF